MVILHPYNKRKDKPMQHTTDLNTFTTEELQAAVKELTSKIKICRELFLVRNDEFFLSDANKAQARLDLINQLIAERGQ